VARTIVIGDVHGCVYELDDLLDQLGHTSDDRVVFVGDMLVRGPEPCAVLERYRRLDARAVRGNHEQRLLRWREQQRRQRAPGKAKPFKRGSMIHTALQLGASDWAIIEQLPLWLRLPAHELLAVHAGLQPGVPLEQQAERTLLYSRCLGPDDEPLEPRDSGPLWGTRYQGPPQVVFGHNARYEPQIHAWATGLDTGCVYGGELTALVLGEGERVAPAAERGDQLARVPARRVYVQT
jgi:hypothetical protein